MASHIHVEKSPEDHSEVLNILFLLPTLRLPNHSLAKTSSSSQSTTSSTTRPQHAFITSPPAPIELRQNNPQDCSNLIIASVNRATVEISRTIIALNATFSQQLQQASISASNGIKSAQGSASSTIAVVVKNADVATSSAFSSVTIANLAVTSANLALTSVASASSSDVSRLSSSLSLLQASLLSIQSSVSATTGAQSTIQGRPDVSRISLTPGEAAAIIVGAVVASILLSFAIYFLVMRMKKRKDRDSYLDEKDFTSSPKKLPSRLSSTFRTGHAMTIQFNPPNSFDAPPPSRSGLHRLKDFHVSSLHSAKIELPQTIAPEVNDSTGGPSSSSPITWPLDSSFTQPVNISPHRSPSLGLMNWPLTFNAIYQTEATPAAHSTPDPMRRPLTSSFFDNAGPSATDLQSSLAAPETIINLNFGLMTAIRNRSTANASLSPRELPIETEGGENLVQESFDNPSEDVVPEWQGETVPTEELNWAPIEGCNEILTSAKEAYDELFRRSFEDSTPRLLNEPIQESFELPIDEPLESAAEVYTEERTNELTLVHVLPQQPLKVLTPQDLASFQENEQPRNNTLLEIKILARNSPQQRAVIGLSPLLGSGVEVLDLEFDRAISPPTLWENSPKKYVSVLSHPAYNSTFTEQRERSHLPPRRSHIIKAGLVENGLNLPQSHPHTATVQREPLPLRPTLVEQREVSPIWQSSYVRNTSSLLAEEKASFDFEKLTDETRVDDHEQRGRSMIRTSDIIEARLSGIAQIKEKNYVEGEKERTLSPLMRNPVDPAMIPADKRDRTGSPFRRDLSKESVAKRNTRTLSSSSHPSSLPREESPLRRNPQLTNIFSLLASDSNAVPTSEVTLKSTSIAQFSQVLSKFQTLDSQNPNDAIAASNVVTQRAIAGIFIPGSLREKAVRNLSKSRERVERSFRG